MELRSPFSRDTYKNIYPYTSRKSEVVSRTLAGEHRARRCKICKISSAHNAKRRVASGESEIFSVYLGHARAHDNARRCHFEVIWN